MEKASKILKMVGGVMILWPVVVVMIGWVLSILFRCSSEGGFGPYNCAVGSDLVEFLMGLSLLGFWTVTPGIFVLAVGLLLSRKVLATQGLPPPPPLLSKATKRFVLIAGILIVFFLVLESIR